MNIKDADSAILFIRGVPGSGKSYLANALEKFLGQQQVLMLDPDKIDQATKDYWEFSKTLSQEGLDQKIHPFRWLRKEACEGINGHKIIIWNQPFTIVDIFNRLVAYLQNYASEHNTRLLVLIVEVEIDHDLAKERVISRKQAGGHGPSENTLIQRIDEYKSYADQGYKTITVDGGDDVSVSVAAVIKALRS